jgi:hypothetical protein
MWLPPKLPTLREPPAGSATGISPLRAKQLVFGMDRTTLEMDLRQAEAHVANGQARTSQQHEIIAELDQEGHDTAPAKDMLASFERTQAMHIANRDRIAGKLAALD